MINFELQYIKGRPAIFLDHVEALSGKTFPEVDETILLSGKKVRITKITYLNVTSLTLKALIDWTEEGL